VDVRALWPIRGPAGLERGPPASLPARGKGRPGARRRRVPKPTILTASEAPDYAFPHSAEDESRRLQLLEQRLDPLTKRRIQRLGVSQGARCLEIGGGRGSITRWLSDAVGATGRVIANDLQLGFLTEIDASNVEVLRHDGLPPLRRDRCHTRPGRPAPRARAAGCSCPGPRLTPRQWEELAVTEGLTGLALREIYLAAKAGHTSRRVIEKDRENARRAA
jgi:hypothetical protein